MAEIDWTVEDAREWTDSLNQSGEAWFRQVALGVKKGIPEILGISRSEWCEQFKVTMRGQERKEAALELKEEGFSNRAIADVLGVDAETVNRDLRAAFAATSEAEQEGQSANGAAFAAPGELPKEKPKSTRGTTGTGENEWYTPKKYVEVVRELFGGEIDLDPASSKAAQKVIQAKKWFSKEQDGLRHKWNGKVWLNPPYAQPLIQQFIDKLLAEIISGRTVEAVLLTHNYTDTTWFQGAGLIAKKICFPRGRIGFLSPDGDVAAPTQGQAFLYFGEHEERFEELFSQFGFVR
jgi:phage N-6-adenine-methyltransferase